MVDTTDPTMVSSSLGQDRVVEQPQQQQYGSSDESVHAEPRRVPEVSDDDEMPPLIDLDDLTPEERRWLQRETNFRNEAYDAFEPDDHFDNPANWGGEGAAEAEGEGGEDEEDEEEDVDVDFMNMQNLRVEYVGKHRMEVVDLTVDDSFLSTDEPGAVPRLVVIDAANVMHGYTPDIVGNSAPQETKQDPAYLLSLVRFFVLKGIECMVVTQHKYMLDNVIDNTFIVNTLRELGIMMVMDSTYDDMVLFSVAGEFDAVIISEDQFRLERQDKDFRTPNAMQALQLRVSPIYPKNSGDFLPKSEWGKVSRNGHFVVDHLLRFQGSTETLRQKFFSTPERGGHRFELVQEKYESWCRRKEDVLAALDALLARIQPLMAKLREDAIELVPRG